MKKILFGLILLFISCLSFANDCTRVDLVQDLASNPNLLEAVRNDRTLIDSWERLQNLGSPLRTDPNWLTNVKQWNTSGVSLSGNGNLISVVDNSGNAIGIIENGKLTPLLYSKSGNPIGNVVNGYQLVDDGSGVYKVKRVADTSAYSQSDLISLYEHQNAHVLERHGHDVTDEALKKRAIHGVAPDGHIATSPPDYSSKFGSSEKLKDALSNTRPGTSNFNPPSSGSSYVFDYPASGQASTPFGYGIPSGGGSAVDMYRVKVVYRKDNGVWKLITMYPQI